jgi:hypothetical protein
MAWSSNPTCALATPEVDPRAVPWPLPSTVPMPKPPQPTLDSPRGRTYSRLERPDLHQRGPEIMLGRDTC